MLKSNTKRGRPSGPGAGFDEQRGRVLAAAAGVFSRSGFDAASMRQIAAASGLSVSALYHYFPSKESLMEGLIEQAAEGPRAGAAAVPPGADLRRLLHSLAAGFFLAAGDPDAKRLIRVVFMAAHERPAWARMYIERLVDPAEAGAAAALAAAMPPRARLRIEPAWLVKQLVGALLSFVIHEEFLRRDGDNHPRRQAYLEQVIEVLAAGVEAIGAADAR